MRYGSELIRKTIHVSSLALPIGLCLAPLELSKPIMVAVTLATVLVDAVRLYEPHFRRLFWFLFGRILREHERHNLLGSTFLLIAALISIFAFPKPVAVVALGFLVVGDTVAALVGKRWGRHKILDKSLEGSLACLAACILVGAIYRLYPGSPLPGAHLTGLELSWIKIAVGALVATLFELLPLPLDDNLRIPLSAGFAMFLAH